MCIRERNKVELQRLLTKVFKEVDKKYNSKLFAGDNIIFDLNNDIIFNMILSLDVYKRQG